MSSSKPIAKNTLFLYVRMILTMGISLYTSRVVLNVLGIEDYGVYSIVGGVVALFGFFNAAMASATQRFLSYDIGKGNHQKLSNTFNATVNIHILIAFIIILFAETLGLWFINNKLNVPVEKLQALNWVYQFSLLTFIISVLQVPYNALIIAREHMKIYAYFSIVEVLLKLAVVYLLFISPFEKLKSYAVLVFIVALIVALFYRIYCKLKFTESKYAFYYDKQLYVELISFSGWSLFGNIAALARGQGTNIILNIFFGTVVNAAYGITSQVRGAVSVFVSNFQLAVNPQIVKTYAQNKLEECHKLIFQSSKISYFLLFIIIIPLLYNVDFILKIWLKDVPQYTNIFVQLALINLLIDSISGPLIIGAQASGKIKWYQIIVGTFIFLDLPVTYLILKVYHQPYLAYVVTIFITVNTLVFRLFFLRKMISLNVLRFCKEVILRIIVISLCAYFVINNLIQTIEFQNEWLGFILRVIFILLINLTFIYIIGISKQEKKIIIKLLNEKFFKKNIQN